ALVPSCSAGTTTSITAGASPRKPLPLMGRGWGGVASMKSCERTESPPPPCPPPSRGRVLCSEVGKAVPSKTYQFLDLRPDPLDRRHRPVEQDRIMRAR